MPPSEATRIRMSAGPGVEPDEMAELARDSSVKVRATLALNPAALPEIDAILAEDGDERVRALLGRKLATLVPNLAADAQLVLRQQTLDTLRRLVADEAERVRSSIAEALKSMPDAPRDLILQLAHDPSVMVSEPVILFSPVLTSQDLIGLIVSAPTADTLTTVARRPGIGGAVSNAIVEAAHDDAIAALLENSSAQIMEATLNALVARAGTEADWQEKLARHPALSASAARALSQIVTAHLLSVLYERSDLDPVLAEELRARMTHWASDPPAPVHKAESDIEAAWRRAAALRDTGQLSDHCFIDVARRGDAGLLGAMLALKAGVAAEVVERATALRSPKGLIALAWRAGLSMRVAQALQIVLGRLQPDQVIFARPSGEYPLSRAEMRWQLEFMFRSGR
jgi:uncharacterized protein (DUF2336 family)